MLLYERHMNKDITGSKQSISRDAGNGAGSNVPDSIVRDTLFISKALEYAVHGYSVMPIRKNKLPLLASWKKYQEHAADDVQIEAWWKKAPNANIGVLTGKVSGITVVDIDMSNGTSVALDTFPKTYTVKTPTGGYHLYYAYAPEIQQTANTFPQFPHVDIRNDGGYVIAPPSRCDYMKEKKRVVGSYKVEHNYPVAAFPLELFNLGKKTRASNLLKNFKVMEDGDGRNNALTKAIGRLLKVTMPSEYEEVAWPVALSLNAQFKTPLSEKEVRATFDSIARREVKKPLSQTEFLKTDKGVVIVNEENVYRTLQADANLAGHFRENIFAGVTESDFEAETWEPLQRSHIIGTQMYLMRTYAHFEHVPHGAVEDAITHYAKKNRISPPVEWFKSLEWDKKPRLDTWLHEVYGVPDDEYHKAVGSNIMKGAVKRAVEPGCKFDYVLVLEGKQGMKKSMSLSVLFGEWHTETVFAPDNKDFFMILANKLMVEFSEGETLSRTEVKRLKAVITMQRDKYRPPYERAARDFPRQCIFSMTTNQNQYLKDETGNRRWLPIAVVKMADVEWIIENKEQLFAEAYYRAIIKGEKTYEFPEEETRAQQAARQTTDPRGEQIYEWYFKTLTKVEREEGITTRQAYVQGVQGLSAISASFGKEMGRMEEMIIGGILRETLFLSRKKAREGRSLFYRYFPTDETNAVEPDDVNIDVGPIVVSTF